VPKMVVFTKPGTYGCTGWRLVQSTGLQFIIEGLEAVCHAHNIRTCRYLAFTDWPMS